MISFISFKGLILIFAGISLTILAVVQGLRGQFAELSVSVALSWFFVIFLIITLILAFFAKVFFHGDFQAVFHFVPTRRKDFIRNIEQEHVDSVLQLLAEEFDKAAKRQQAFLKNPPPQIREDKVFAEALEELVAGQKMDEKILTENVRKAKKDFWRAHDLAKKEGYKVKSTFTAHL